MRSNGRAEDRATWHGVSWIVIGMIVGIGTGLTVWSQILGNLSVGVVVGLSTGLLLGVALVDLQPRDD